MDNRETRYIIFGSGPLGLSVMDALIEYERNCITIVNRRGVADEPLPAGVQVIAGDATRPDTVAQLCAGADVVFHCAQPKYTEWPEKFPPITMGILEGVARTNARLVMGDNLYMYGPTNGQPIHEDLPYAAAGHKGKTRVAMARAVLDAHQAGKVRAAIGRGSDFYGPRVSGSALGDIFFGPALAGKTVNVLGSPDLPHSYTFIRDFGRGLVTLSEQEVTYGRAWHIPNPPTISTRQFANLVANEIGRPVKLRAAGKWMIAALGLFVPEVREMKEMFYEFAEPYVVDHSQFVAAFGDRHTTYEEAIRETVAWFRNHA
ncbi:MAG TPA: NAD-dependent epimerase/dehydratase family protein [Chloroflexota bacterium]|nr:NAD-dependent epimerase/dehydratase family protein [Chloroflexota bacterium]HUM71792.1 NAD-dependent epimerase/dehydratase family protein [Chloroflexota bacterium]